MINEKRHYSEQVKRTLVRASLRVLKPLVRVLLRNGIPYHAAADMLKWAYVDTAREDFRYAGRKQSKSRLSILTGLSRVEVDRVVKRPEPENDPELVLYNRAARVVTGWLEDKDFCQQQSPLVLELDGVGSGFNELVRRYSGGAPVRAMLDELVRLKIVDFVSDNKIKLIKHALIAESDAHGLEKLAILGLSAGDLLETLDHNIYDKLGKGRFQRVIFSQNIPTEKLEELRAYAFVEGQTCSDKLDQKLFDLSNSEQNTEKVRAGFGIYYFEDEPN
ncbi:MAG: DUF6502 family protein [bacterium]